MIGESKQASSATMAIVYITVGALLDVWTIVYYIYSHQGERTSSSGSTGLICLGLFVTGIVLIGIGLLVGRIGRSARQAEVAATPTMPAAVGAVTQGAVPQVVTATAQPANAQPAQPVV